MLTVSFRKNGQQKPYVIANFFDWNDAWGACQSARDFCFEAFEKTRNSSVEAKVRAQYRRSEERDAETITVDEKEMTLDEWLSFSYPEEEEEDEEDL